MKPKHTAEQSTTRVNKSEALGKKGFAGLFQQSKPIEDTVTTTETVLVEVEEKITIIEEVKITSPQVESIKSEAPVMPQNMAMKKQKAAFTPLSELKSVATAVQQQPRPKVTIHGPEDPMDALLCEGCQ